MVLNATIDTFSYYACVVLRAVLLHWVAFFLAIGMVLQRYARPLIKPDGLLGRHLRNPTTRTFGVGVIILQLFYAEWLQSMVTFQDGPQPLIISLILLFTESCLQIVIDYWEYTRHTEFCLQLHDLKVENRYQDVTIKLRRVMLYFWVQIALMAYLLYFVNNDEKLHSGKLDSILKWLVALNLTQVTSDDEAGTRFHISYWLCLLKTDIPEEVKNGKDRFCECIPIGFKCHWFFRALLDFFINGISRVVVMGIAPIYLADTDAMDFIKDSLALFFVTRLDDYDDIIYLGEKIKQYLQRRSPGANIKLEWLLEAIDQDAEEAGTSGSLDQRPSSYGNNSRDTSTRQRLLPAEDLSS